MTDFIRTQVRRANRNLLLWNAALLIGMLVLTWFLRTYWYGFFFGPIRADDETLLALARAPGSGLGTYVELDGRPLTATGFTEVNTRDGKPRASYPFFMTPVGDRLLLVLAETQSNHLLGTVYPVPGDVERDVIDKVVQQHPALRGRFLPVMLNATVAFPVFGWICLAIGVPLGLFCLINLTKGVLRSINPRWHPMARPAEIAAEIEQELTEDTVERIGPLLVTRSWLLQPTTFGLRRIRLDDTVWLCEITGARYGLLFRLRNGRTTGVLTWRKQAQPALQAVFKRIPWVLVGFDLERLRQWQKQREQMIAVVDARRKQMRGGRD